MVSAGGSRDPDLMHDRGNSGRLGTLLAPRDRQRKFVASMVLRAFKVTKEQLAEDPGRCGEMFDRVDGWIADGVLNGPELNCADFQIATSLALVDYRLDVRPRMQERPLYGLVERLLPL